MANSSTSSDKLLYAERLALVSFWGQLAEKACASAFYLYILDIFLWQAHPFSQALLCRVRLSRSRHRSIPQGFLPLASPALAVPSTRQTLYGLLCIPSRLWA